MQIFNFYRDIRDAIDGYKTYIVAVAIAVFTGLEVYGIDVDPNVYKLFALLGLGAVRSAMAKIEDALGEANNSDGG